MLETLDGVEVWFRAMEAEPLWASLEFWLVLLTAALALATLALWRATERLVKGADTSAERQLRAYLAVEEPILIEPLKLGERPRFQFKIRNVGQTPAFGVSSWALGKVTVSFENPNLPETAEMPPSDFVMAPSQTLTVDMRPLHTLDQDAIDRIAQGTAWLFVWGRVSYRDAFGKPRHTSFRFFHGQHAAAEPGSKFQRPFTGNDAD